MLLLGYDAGTIHIPANAAVVIACLRQITRRSRDPVSLGGVSMGGQITRYALAWLESTGQSHPCALYFSIDTPPLGSVTSVGVQWFVREFAPVLSAAADLAWLIATPANREFLIAFLHAEDVSPDPAHLALLADFQAVGNFPKQPRCIAIASGHGRGGRFLEAGAPLLEWSGHPFAEAVLRVSGPDPNQFVAEGACYPDPGHRTKVAYVNPDSWEGVPGGQAAYIAMAAAIAQSAGYGEITLHSPRVCVVPTVSALCLAQAPDAPIPASPPSGSPFHAWATADENLNHCELSAATAEFLIREIASLPGACDP